MSVRYPVDPFAMPNRPDADFPFAGPALPDPGRVPLGRRLRLAVLAVAAFAAAVGVVAAVLFMPVLLHDLTSLQAVQRHGEVMLMAQYTERLMSLFLGTVVLSGALVSFALAVVLSARRSRVLVPVRRSRTQPRAIGARLELNDVHAL